MNCGCEHETRIVYVVNGQDGHYWTDTRQVWPNGVARWDHPTGRDGVVCDEDRRGWIAGPFETRAEAEALREIFQREQDEEDGM